MPGLLDGRQDTQALWRRYPNYALAMPKVRVKPGDVSNVNIFANQTWNNDTFSGQVV